MVGSLSPPEKYESSPQVAVAAQEALVVLEASDLV